VSDTPASGEADRRGWLAPLLAPLWPRLRELVVFSLFINLLALATPVFILQVYDRVVFHAGIDTLKGLAIGMMVVIVFDFVLRQARSRLMQRVALRIDVDLGKRLFDKLHGLPLRVLESRPTPYWQSLFRDAEVVRNVVGGPTAVLMVDLPFVVLFIALIYVIAEPIVWVLVVALVAFVVLAVTSSWTVQRAARRERDAGLDRDGLIAEMIAGRATIKALDLGPAMRPAWEERHADVIERSLGRGVKIDGFGNLGAGMTILTTIAMTAVGALAILDQQMTIGALIAANMLGGRIIGPLNQLVGTWRTLAAYRQSAKRLNAVFQSAETRRQGEVELPRPTGVLALDDVSFAFEPGLAPVIDGIRFSVKPGGLHGIVGRNGSGKTTLLKLMQGLYAPDQGRVLLDGGDIAQYGRRDLARWIGYVPQDPFLFAASVRDNIAVREPDADDDMIVGAARLAGVHDMIIDLPDGYGTDIGEAGGRLSAGMRQRIAIARALVGDPPVLLMDEPTSSLDRETEESLRTVLAELSREHNVVVVTHSPILLAACNNIIAMERGRIAMAGPAHEIMPKLFGGRRQGPPLERRK
jgi:PrtD family type I secretion system ABC transporter